MNEIKWTLGDKIDQISPPPPPPCKTCFSTSEWIWHTKNTWSIYKSFGNWEDPLPPPIWEKSPNNPVIFFWVRTYAAFHWKTLEGLWHIGAICTERNMFTAQVTRHTVFGSKWFLHYFSELQLWARAVIWEACPPGVFSGHVHSAQRCIVCNIHSCAKDGVNGAHYTQLVCVLIIPVVQIIIARQVEERQKRESMMEIELGLLFLIFLEPESSSWNLNCTVGHSGLEMHQFSLIQ